ncbi:hypothetical protein G7Y89_g15102 [Cudoniella acicularis]|uniref:Roadblock/LAMTOR2 domain-containing protein n=1 Tax=Cudoniella acicularis TaxID=354080 RepID=A0A8H4QUF7_9HELO|nr:hypothetical protein G7Y89_g15102 [Cudoniella acicularis]
MLLTKPLTTFLSQNTSPQLPTLLLISPDGKLLSSSSPLSASTLRTQSTVACTLWNLYNPSQNSNNQISAALGVASQTTSQLPTSSTSNSNDLSSITIQLSQGIMVIRALSCGLLFVAIGPTITASTSTSPFPSSHALLASAHTSPPSSPQAQENHEPLGERSLSGGSLAVGSGTPSESGSVGSSVTGARTQATILGIKRQADEVGRWLEGQLKGFKLSSEEER